MPARRYAHGAEVPDSDRIELRREAAQASALLLPVPIEEVALARCAHTTDCVLAPVARRNASVAHATNPDLLFRDQSFAGAMVNTWPPGIIWVPP
jgi:hypothetical protein